ncbi:MAG: radical SAM protein [Deltaproteobacteria bacterium]|nr:radical SAM protein [Deltaproteobacteria bacterium]
MATKSTPLVPKRRALPAQTFTIRTVEELERRCDLSYAPEERGPLQEVLDRFVVRLTPHVVDLMRHSEAVTREFLPDARELDDDQGQTHCFTGLLARGAPACLERAYVDRCILMPQPHCPATCRFCFRKFYERQGKTSEEDLAAALAYIGREKDLREVLITGGEPILDKRLPWILGELRRLEHLGPLRVACRSLITQPSLIDDVFIATLVAHQDLRAGKPIEVALHCNHPDELSPPTIDALARLREAGIHVYNQTVLLRGVNLDAETMLRLGRELRRYGVENYHLYFGGPVRGVDHWRPTLDEALALKRALREAATGRLIPHLIVTTRLGKVELGVDGDVVEREIDGRHVWLSTPYHLEMLQRVDPTFVLPSDARVGMSGMLELRYLDGPSACS